MKKILSERNIAALLFVLVLVVFSFAQSESKKMGLVNNDTVSPLFKMKQSQFTETSVTPPKSSAVSSIR